MRKPRVITRCVASRYATPDERIVEFSFPGTNGPVGGLISLRMWNGKPVINLYRVDKAVTVRVSKEK